MSYKCICDKCNESIDFESDVVEIKVTHPKSNEILTLHAHARCYESMFKYSKEPSMDKSNSKLSWYEPCAYISSKGYAQINYALLHNLLLLEVDINHIAKELDIPITSLYAYKLIFEKTPLTFKSKVSDDQLKSTLHHYIKVLPSLFHRLRMGNLDMMKEATDLGIDADSAYLICTNLPWFFGIIEEG